MNVAGLQLGIRLFSIKAEKLSQPLQIYIAVPKEAGP